MPGDLAISAGPGINHTIHKLDLDPGCSLGKIQMSSLSVSCGHARAPGPLQKGALPSPAQVSTRAPHPSLSTADMNYLGSPNPCLLWSSPSSLSQPWADPLLGRVSEYSNQN